MPFNTDVEHCSSHLAQMNGTARYLVHNQVQTADPTSGYATWFTAGGAIRIAHYDVIDDVITGKL